MKEFTNEEQGLINVVELAMDWNLPVLDEDYKRYIELVESNRGD